MGSAQTERMSPKVEEFEAPSAAFGKQLATWHILVLVVFVTFLAYARTLSFEFIYDDIPYLVNNAALHSWRNLPSYFTKDLWQGVSPGAAGNYYRPVFMIWCRLNDALFGQQAGLWHLTTVATHVLACVFVYYLALRLVQDRLTAGIAALIFGVHPIHIESVAWILGVNDSLPAIFIIGSFLCYLNARQEKRSAGGWMALSLILYVLGMLTKEIGVMVPGIIVVYEWIYGDGSDQGSTWKVAFERAVKALWSASSYFLLIIPYFVARVNALKGFVPTIAPIPVREVLYTWPALIWFWISHLIVPAGLLTFYDLRTVQQPGLINFALPAAAVTACVAGLAWAAKRSREVAFACAWIVIPLIPLLDIRLFARNGFTHDRFLYLPSVGLALVVAIALRKARAGKARLFGYPALQIVGAFVLATVLGFGTFYQSAYFRNNRVFYRYNYIMAPDSLFAKSNYAAYLGESGQYADSARLFEEVLKEFPGDSTAYYDLGHDYYQLDRLPEAVFYLGRAAALEPNRPGPLLGLGLAWFRLKQYDKAEAAFRRAIALQPNGFGFHFALGTVLKERGKTAEALKEFKLELAANPDDLAAKREIVEIADRPKGSGD